MVRIIITIVIIIIISPGPGRAGAGWAQGRCCARRHLTCVESVELGRAPGPVTTSSLQTRDRFWPGALLAQARLTP